jgi:hypothetical protein
MKDFKEAVTEIIEDVNEDILSDDADAAKGWVPVALKLVGLNADMEV